MHPHNLEGKGIMRVHCESSGSVRFMGRVPNHRSIFVYLGHTNVDKFCHQQFYKARQYHLIECLFLIPIRMDKDLWLMND